MMQAVILCESDEIGPAELGLPAAGQGFTPPVVGTAPSAGEPARSVPVLGRPTPDVPPREATPERPAPRFDELREQLQRTLSRQIEGAADAGSGMVLPLGKWLNDDVILEADAATHGVARRGSAIVGIPETTYRRRAQRARAQERAGLSPRSGTWSEVRNILAAIVRCHDLEGRNLLESFGELLLEEILARFPTEVRIGSALLGVTAPTYRSRVTKLSASS